MKTTIVSEKLYLPYYSTFSTHKSFLNNMFKHISYDGNFDNDFRIVFDSIYEDAQSELNVDLSSISKYTMQGLSINEVKDTKEEDINVIYDKQYDGGNFKNLILNNLTSFYKNIKCLFSSFDKCDNCNYVHLTNCKIKIHKTLVKCKLYNKYYIYQIELILDKENSKVRRFSKIDKSLIAV